MPEQARVMVFVDGNNFYFGLKALGVRIYALDFRKLVSALMMSDRIHLKTFFYAAPVDQKEVPNLYAKQQTLLSDLRAQDVQVEYGYLQNRRVKCPKCDEQFSGGFKCSSCGHVFGKKQEKGVDVFLATDLVYYAATNQYDIAYIITSDGDLAQACKRAREIGKIVFYVCLPPESFHLRQNCDAVIRKTGTFYSACLM